MHAEADPPASRATLKSQHEMTVCNACRYCEAYCPVFQAMEDRLTFTPGDVAYLANLCHNCGECLYACQYAPPHEFGIDVPKTFSEVRVESYADSAWPHVAGRAFRRPWITAVGSLAASVVLTRVLVAPMSSVRGGGADFYSVIPHDVMVVLFGLALTFAAVALGMGQRRFARAIAGPAPRAARPTSLLPAARDALTLRHLHPSDQDCTDAEEQRRPWRRWMHHCTFYGFLLCAASTSVAAVYHMVFGWVAPYGYTSIPVVLGTTGGIGLLIGPAGLFLLDRQRDPELTHVTQKALDGPFLWMLFLTSFTGIALLVLRERPVMPTLLIVHLAFVLALFITLPYTKFVHGVYRAAALVKFRSESSHDAAATST